MSICPSEDAPLQQHSHGISALVPECHQNTHVPELTAGAAPKEIPGDQSGTRSLAAQQTCLALAGAPATVVAGRVRSKEQVLTPGKHPAQHRARATASCECLDSAPSLSCPQARL